MMGGLLEMNTEFVNDIYHNFTAQFDWGNKMKGISIYPVTDEIVAKYMPKKVINYVETYEVYETKLVPHVLSQAEKKNKVSELSI